MFLTLNARKNLWFIFCVLGIIGFTIISPNKVIDGVEYATGLCLKTLLPSLLPFLICANMLLKFNFDMFVSKASNKMFKNISNYITPFILGSVCGFPVGAFVITSIYKKGHISKNEAEYLLGICSNASPIFVILTMGVGMYGNKYIGYALLFTHIFASIITAIIFFHPFCKPDKTSR